MPYVFEQLWQKLGRRLQDDLTLVSAARDLPLPLDRRHRHRRGRRLLAAPDVARFLAYSRGLYDLSADAFLHHPLGEWWRQLNAGGICPNCATCRRSRRSKRCTVVVRRFFGDDPHLVQLVRPFCDLQRFVAVPDARRVQHHPLRRGKIWRLVRQGRAV